MTQSVGTSSLCTLWRSAFCSDSHCQSSIHTTAEHWVALKFLPLYQLAHHPSSQSPEKSQDMESEDKFPARVSHTGPLIQMSTESFVSVETS